MCLCVCVCACVRACVCVCMGGGGGTDSKRVLVLHFPPQSKYVDISDLFCFVICLEITLEF